MAESSAGAAAAPRAIAPAPAPTPPSSPGFWGWLARAFLSLWWLFVVGLATGVVTYLANHAGPILLPRLPQVMDWVQHLPRLAQFGLALGGLLVLAAMAWLTYLAWRHRQRQAVEEVDADLARQTGAFEGALDRTLTPRLDDIQAGVREAAAQGAVIQDQTGALLDQGTRIEQQVTVIAARLTQDAPAVPAGVVSPSGLPRPGTLVGRARELADLEARLRAGGSIGVFAIEGLAGIGKTALAATAVADLAADRATFPGGAAWISCEGLSGDEGLAEVWARVARALGADDVAALAIPERRRVALRAALSDPARPRLLLALDNVEPELDAEAVLNTLAGGQATLLLTARQKVAPSRLEAIELHPLADPAAVELFTQRLRQVDGTRPTPQEQSDVVTLAALLGGLPLAIELAAAYAGVQKQPLAAIVTEVREAPMTGGPLRGLRARFERSWTVLTPAQQRLLTGLAVLEGPTFPRAAALAIAGAAVDDTLDAEPTAERDERAGADVDALVSLALVEPQAASRLRLHPLLREYAAERLGTLPTATAEQLGDAVLRYWVAFAEMHISEGGTNVANMDALEAEAPGLLGAISWAHDHQRWEALLDLVQAIDYSWDLRGRHDEERRFLPWAVEAARKGGELSDQLFMVHALAVLDADAGDVAQARAGYQEALRLAQELGDKSAIQAETHELAVLDAEAGDVAQARAGYQEALRLAQELGDKRAIQRETHGLAVRDAEAGDVAQARAGYQEALRLAQELGDKRAVRAETHELAVLDAEAGDVAQARAGYQEALRLAQELGDKSAVRAETHALAVRDAEAGDVAQARAGFQEALRLAQELGDKSAVRAETHALAVLDAEAGDVAQARAGYQEALRLAQELGDKSAVRAETHELAVRDAEAGDVAQARAGYQEALRLAQELGDKAAQSSELQALGSADIDRQDFARARAELQEALELARHVEQPTVIVEAVWWLAELDRKEGHREAACSGFREALALYEQLGHPDAEITRRRLQELGCEP